MNKKSTFFVTVLFLSLFIGCTSVESLLKEGKLKEAEKYCEEVNSEKKKECYLLLAVAYFEKNDYEKAGFFYEKAENKDGLEKVADAFFTKADYNNSGLYYDKIGDKDGLKKVADVFFTKADYLNAGKYFAKVGFTEGIKKITDIFFKNGDYSNASRFFENIEGLTNINSPMTDTESVDKLYWPVVLNAKVNDSRVWTPNPIHIKKEGFMISIGDPKPVGINGIDVTWGPISAGVEKRIILFLKGTGGYGASVEIFINGFKIWAVNGQFADNSPMGYSSGIINIASVVAANGQYLLRIKTDDSGLGAIIREIYVTSR